MSTPYWHCARRARCPSLCKLNSILSRRLRVCLHPHRHCQHPPHPTPPPPPTTTTTPPHHHAVPEERKRLRLKEPEKFGWHPKELITQVGRGGCLCLGGRVGAPSAVRPHCRRPGPDPSTRSPTCSPPPPVPPPLPRGNPRAACHTPFHTRPCRCYILPASPSLLPPAPPAAGPDPPVSVPSAPPGVGAGAASLLPLPPAAAAAAAACPAVFCFWRLLGVGHEARLVAGVCLDLYHASPSPFSRRLRQQTPTTWGDPITSLPLAILVLRPTCYRLAPVHAGGGGRHGLPGASAGAVCRDDHGEDVAAGRQAAGGQAGRQGSV